MRTKCSPRVIASHGQTSARQCPRPHLTTSGPAPHDSSHLSPGPPLPSSAPSSTSTLYALSTAGGLSGLQLHVQHTAQTRTCPVNSRPPSRLLARSPALPSPRPSELATLGASQSHPPSTTTPPPIRRIPPPLQTHLTESPRPRITPPPHPRRGLRLNHEATTMLSPLTLPHTRPVTKPPCLHLHDAPHGPGVCQLPAPPPVSTRVQTRRTTP